MTFHLWVYVSTYQPQILRIVRIRTQFRVSVPERREKYSHYFPNGQRYCLPPTSVGQTFGSRDTYTTRKIFNGWIKWFSYFKMVSGKISLFLTSAFLQLRALNTFKELSPGRRFRLLDSIAVFESVQSKLSIQNRTMTYGCSSSARENVTRRFVKY